MREQFDRDLAALRQELISIYTDVDLELHDAVEALVNCDEAQAKLSTAATRDIDKRCSELEDKAYELIVLQQPVASDLRLLQFIIYVDFNLARMSNHTRNIAKSARRARKAATANDVKVPKRLLDLLASQGHLVYRVLGAAIEAIVENDLSLASSLPELDEPVDGLYKQFFKALKSTELESLPVTSEIIMAARMLERISDNSVETGERLVFLLTGKRTNLRELADLDEDELPGLYVARGAGLTLDADRDINIASQIPELAHSEGPVGQAAQAALSSAEEDRKPAEKSK